MLIKFVTNRLWICLIIIGFALFCFVPVFAQKLTGKPITKNGLLIAARMGKSTRDLVLLINRNGVNFPMNAATERELTNAKLRPEVVEAVQNNLRGTTPVTSIAANRTSATTSNVNVSVDKEEKETENYEQLYFQAVGLFNQLRTSTSPQQASGIAQNIQNLGNQAIRQSPDRPEAYTILGYLSLLKGDVDNAERYGQEAINRGGTLRFSVYHLEGSPHLETLYINKDYVSVESGQKYHPFNNREINKVEPQNSINVMGRNVAVFNLCTTKNNSHYDWYFSPADTGTPQEANLIMRLIQRNALIGR